MPNCHQFDVDSWLFEVPSVVSTSASNAKLQELAVDATERKLQFEELTSV